MPQPSQTGSLLKCYYFNARSLKNKLTELQLLLHEHIYDVTSVSETWLEESIPDSLCWMVAVIQCFDAIDVTTM